ncbi:probable E3 ubiquitin-protein ligase MID2 [Saccostrea echinata]|uniref:probable E3 ubiquitin-protein ligase MID2 n=1 Tax=Saccostrea echinata TaxID=191078 RepID=UPI002A81521B|nr:probable E3 ubiquitin-protein ligase MID2 [Saccostrea echinata]
MDPTSTSAHMRCDLCNTAVVQMGCDTCLVNLCKACVGEHMTSDESKEHKIVRFTLRKSSPLYPFCASHIKKRCEMYCNQCDIPVCAACLRSDQHLGHELIKILKVLDEKKKKIIKEQTELKNTIYPNYQDIASDVQNRMRQLKKEHEDLSTAITKHGEDWHREIDKLVKKLKDEVDEMKNIQFQTLQNHMDEIKKKISDIKDEINSIERLVNYIDITKLINVTTNIEGYKNSPQIIEPSLPKFALGKIEGDEFNKMFGGLSSSLLEEDKLDYSMKSKEKSPEASLPFKQFIDEPEIITTLNTNYHLLYNVACLNDDEIWTTGQDSTIKLFSISQGSLLKSIATKSEYRPYDIAVTKNGDLVYVDTMDGTVNIVKNKKIQKMVRKKSWIPNGACSTTSGEFLFIMYNNDNERTQVFRYHGSMEKQSIELDEEGKPLYSSGPAGRCITENRNLDICVSDNKARAVVVVNQAGKLRFRYTGHTPAPKNEPFSPQGIATDSQGHILTADYINDCVHIIDQDGQFLHYIHCGISGPLGLCIDTDDSLFVAEYRSKQVKKIKFLM